MRRRFEELGCPDQVDIYGVGPHFVGGSSFFSGASPPTKEKKENPGPGTSLGKKTGILLGKVLIYIMSYYRNFMVRLKWDLTNYVGVVK